MAFTLRVKPKVQKNIDKLSEQYRQRFLGILDAIEADPFSGKKLHGKREGQYSVRVWPYRIIYKIYKNELLILVIDFGHRGGVYKNKL